MDVRGVHIDINKTIPTQAGLAGGSSDGAAVIMGLNAMFSTMLKSDEMRAIGEKVGADVPFCIEGGTKLCTGTGTTIKKLPTFRCSDIVICKPDTVSVSTAEAYSKVDALSPHPSYTDEMVKALYSRDMFMISTTIFNDFELALQIPEVNEIKRVHDDIQRLRACPANPRGERNQARHALLQGERRGHERLRLCGVRNLHYLRQG